MDTNFTKLIDWEKEQTYADFADLFRAYAETLERSAVTSRSGHLIDGHAKRAFLEHLQRMAELCDTAPEWLYVRQQTNYTRNEGHQRQT